MHPEGAKILCKKIASEAPNESTPILLFQLKKKERKINYIFIYSAAWFLINWKYVDALIGQKLTRKANGLKRLED